MGSIGDQLLDMPDYLFFNVYVSAALRDAYPESHVARDVSRDGCPEQQKVGMKTCNILSDNNEFIHCDCETIITPSLSFTYCEYWKQMVCRGVGGSILVFWNFRSFDGMCRRGSGPRGTWQASEGHSYLAITLTMYIIIAACQGR